MEMQIEMNLRYHLTPVRMAKIKNINVSLFWKECGVRVGMKMYATTLVIVWWFLRKLGPNLPQNPVIPLLGIYPKDVQSYYKDTCSSMLIEALSVIARTWKQPRYPSTREWIKNM